MRPPPFLRRLAELQRDRSSRVQDALEPGAIEQGNDLVDHQVQVGGADGCPSLLHRGRKYPLQGLLAAPGNTGAARPASEHWSTALPQEAPSPGAVGDSLPRRGAGPGRDRRRSASRPLRCSVAASIRYRLPGRPAAARGPGHPPCREVVSDPPRRAARRLTSAIRLTVAASIPSTGRDRPGGSRGPARRRCAWSTILETALSIPVYRTMLVHSTNRLACATSVRHTACLLWTTRRMTISASSVGQGRRPLSCAVTPYLTAAEPWSPRRSRWSPRSARSCGTKQ